MVLQKPIMLNIGVAIEHMLHRGASLWTGVKIFL